MASAWVLIPSLIKLRTEFNIVNPNRDKGADGSIGDSAHTSRSDHSPDEDSDYLRDHDGDSKNEVHALDIDSSGPWPSKTWFNDTIEKIRREERRRWLDPNDKCRLKYIIWNRRIASQDSDFEWVAYSGSDPHTNHAHLSGRYETACENDTRPWGVATEEDMSLDNSDLNKIRDIVKQETAASVAAFLNVKIGDANHAPRTVGDVLRDVAKLRGYLIGDAGDTKNAAIAATAPIARLLTVADAVAELENAIDSIAGGPVTEEVLLSALRTVLREGVER